MALYVMLSRAVRAMQSGGTCHLRGALPACPPCVPAVQGAARARGASSLAEGGGTCHERGALPTCPPCVPAPQPPCRARQPPASRGTRVVCCAPPKGARPPCPRPPPALPLTCRDAVREAQISQNQPSECGCDQDPVALRLQIARNARRADYEWEVACRAATPPTPPDCPAPYALGRERECARATDGCTYAVLHEHSAPCAHPTRCGPGRTPPPPRCVELAPDDACRIKGDVHLDPCAHRPRVMIEIDRGTCTTPASPPPAFPQTSTSSCANTASTPAAQCRQASRCATLPAPNSLPPRCRRPTIVERLRARPPDCQSERRTHTSVTLSLAAKSLSAVSGGLDGMLRSKKQLKEAGLGRVVTNVGAGLGRQGKPPGGRLELCVPPGTERVAVHVSMTGAAGGSCPNSASTSVSCADASCPPTWVTKSPFSCANFKKRPAPFDPPSPPCGHSAPTHCNSGPKTTTKRCSSTSAFMANTIVINS